MRPLLASYVLLILGYVAFVYLTMRRSIQPRKKAFIYGTLTLVLLLGIFFSFAHYESHWKAPVPAENK